MISEMIMVGMISFIAGLLVHEFVFMKTRKKHLGSMEENYEKVSEFYSVLVQWIKIHNEGRQLSEYFMRNGYRTIAIYGMKELGKCLLEELKNTNIEVLYAIDQAAENIYAEIDVVKPTDQLREVDVVVITAIHYYESIAPKLEEILKCPILSIEDVVFEA